MMVRTYALLSLLTLILIGNLGCKHPIKPLHYYNVNSLDSLVLREMQKKSIVLFGDAYPNHITYLQAVSSILNYWVDRVAKNPLDANQPRKVILALEHESGVISAIKNYVATGNRSLLFRDILEEQLNRDFRGYFNADNPTVDFYQFIEELHLVKLRIEDFNKRNPGQTISLQIVPASIDPPYTIAEIRTMSQSKFNQLRFLWYSKERTVQSSSWLVRCLKDNPDYKILVVYDARSLGRMFSGLDFSLAHSLDSLVGRESVDVFQSTRFPAKLNAEQNYAIDPTTAIEEFPHDAETEDFLLRKDVIPAYPFPLYMVKSVNTLAPFSELAARFNASKDLTDKVIAKRSFKRALSLLQRSYFSLEPGKNSEIRSLSQDLSRIPRLHAIPKVMFTRLSRLIRQFDAVKDILSIDGVISKQSNSNSTEYMGELLRVLDNLPSKSVPSQDSTPKLILPGEQLAASTTEWARKWKNRKPEILTYMLIQLSWIGTPEDIEEGMKALRFITKQDYQNPSEWSKWWISTYR